MHTIETILALLIAVAALAWLAGKVRIPYPIVMVLGGLGISFIPHLPRVTLDPSVVFILFLPPLLYQAGTITSWRDFRTHIRPISMLATGLVLFTTCTVAVVAHFVVDGLSWPSAFVLGAIVSPPDAVAAVTIMQRLRVPRYVQAILEGESLVNDATALVAYRFATAAVLAGTFSLGEASLRFVIVTIGGIVVGYFAGMVVAWVRPRLRDDSVETVVSLMTPYVAYLPAEWMGVSGVLAAVTAGIFIGRRLPRIATSSSRLRLFAVWETVVFLMNGLIFVLIGLQLPGVLDRLQMFSMTTLAGYGLVICLAAILVRMGWVLGATYIARRVLPWLNSAEPVPPFSSVLLVAWTGMRGIVSLAAAMALPMTLTDHSTPFPGRDLIVFLTFCVILFTLVVQGISLPWLIRLLRISATDEDVREEDLARMELAHAALARLYGLALVNEAAAERIQAVREPYEERARYLSDIVRGHRGTGPGHTAEDHEVCESTQRIRREAIETERAMLVKLRDDGVIGDEVLRRIQKELDLEESQLDSGHR